MVSGIAVPPAIAACQLPMQPVHAIVTCEVLTTVAMVPPSGSEPPPMNFPMSPATKWAVADVTVRLPAVVTPSTTAWDVVLATTATFPVPPPATVFRLSVTVEPLTATTKLPGATPGASMEWLMSAAPMPTWADVGAEVIVVTPTVASLTFTERAEPECHVAVG